MKIIKVNIKDLDMNLKTPFLNYTRKLLKEGYPEDTVVEFYRERETPDFTIKHIGRAAKLTVDETKGVRFKKLSREMLNKMSIKVSP